MREPSLLTLYSSHTQMKTSSGCHSWEDPTVGPVAAGCIAVLLYSLRHCQCGFSDSEWQTFLAQLEAAGPDRASIQVLRVLPVQ